MAPLLMLAMYKFFPEVNRFYWRDIQHELPGLNGSVGCMKFSPDSRHLIVVGEENPIKKIWIRNWDLKEWRVQWESSQSGVSGRISYSHDGRRIAITTLPPGFVAKPIVDYDGCASDWQTVLYKEVDGARLAVLPGRINLGEPFLSKNGKNFFLQDNKCFWAWDSRAMNHAWRTPPLRKQKSFVHTVVSADSTVVAALRRRIVVGKRAVNILRAYDHDIVVFDTINGRYLTSWAIEGDSYPEAFSVDNKFIWCRGNQMKSVEITIWDWKIIGVSKNFRIPKILWVCSNHQEV